MPFIVLPKARLRTVRAEALTVVVTPEMVPRNCHLEAPALLKNIKAIPCSDQFIAYASPDSTYAVTRRLFDAAKKKILIGIYDFTATYMKELVINAMNRGVKVSLMLDVDNTDEEKLMKDLAKLGAQTVSAPSCANKMPTHYFASSHEKVIVIDDTWCLVQSGNYSNNSIPFNEKDGGDPTHFITGNRDMGVAIKSAALSAFFTKVLKADIKLELGIEAAQALVAPQPELPELFEAVPELLPKQLFPSKTLTPKKPIDVLPILSPDNYMDVIPKMLAAAKTSILIENQYIRSSQPLIAQLLEAIKTAVKNNPKLDVRIILGKLFSQADVPKEKANVANMKKLYKLALGTNIRYIDVKRFVHCHNKLIIIDGKTVLTSSQNWSDSAVSKNREAGVVMTYPDLAAYYTKIFESDWSTASKTIPIPPKNVAAPETLMTGKFVKVVPADYEEV
ncbi:phospholipase D-like domain-containing protein [Flavitalea sp. BT771]|uniref:phospholipase D-like domain-containing protein n=1 Tax=Flavitalea sp. BT771 TaxID=3063329 RepID=UPI0026E165FF|nr:phospholipase D-like domain-containing protein [Flavitalea sp. BT771]MDO6433117.1 phospholipase D-like domain-containing protein [Flavitalea sp. BT771]MDV6221607.1 phospholipase D-like domain-containing protein [Flavitalea sp. BT771]